MASWEDYLTSFDKAQEDVNITWGADIRKTPASSRTEARKTQSDHRKQAAANAAKFVGNMGTPTAIKRVDPKDLERIEKLQALATNVGATTHEKTAALAAIERIKNKKGA